METHPVNQIGAKASIIQDSKSALPQLTSEQLLNLGMNQVVYLQSGMCQGEMLFVVFDADGMPVIAADDVDVVVKSAIEHGLSFVCGALMRPWQS